MKSRALNPLAMLRHFFGPVAPHPADVRVVSPKDVHPDSINEGLLRLRPYVQGPRAEFNRADPTLPRYVGPAYEDLMAFARRSSDAETPALDREVRSFLTDVRSANNLTGEIAKDMSSGMPSNYRFLFDPKRGITYGGVRTDRVPQPTSPLARMSEGSDIEEIHALGSMMPGGGTTLLRAAQEAYDPSHRRATSLMSLPRAEPFYERRGMINLEREDPDLVGEAVNWQTHVLPRGERFRRGGLARAAC